MKRLILFLLVLECGSLLPPLRGGSLLPPQADPVLTAEKAIEAKDYATALRILNDHVAKNPNDYRALFDIAYAYTLMGDRAQAIAAYRKTLQVQPQLPQASLNLGLLLLEEKQPAEAAKYFSDVVAARPKDARAQALLAEAILATGDTARAAEEFRKALALDPKSYDAVVALARIAAAQKDYAGAAGYLEKALALKPGDAAAQLELARVYELTDRQADASRIYSELLQKQPENAAVHRRQGELLLAQKKFAEALASFETAARLAPAPEDRWLLARAYSGAKQDDKALPLLAEVIAADPRNYDARLLLARALSHKRDFAAAQKQLEAAITLRPDVTDAWVDLANMLYLQENYPGTLAVLDRVAKMGVRTPWLYFLRAITLDKLDQVEPALESYQQFLGISKGELPDQEFQARQRSRALEKRLEKSGKRRRSR